MATPQPPPDLRIPHSDSTVEVSIIDTKGHLKLPAAMFVEPQVPGFDTLNACVYSFLIKHRRNGSPEKYDTLVFNLGMRKDWENGAKSIVDMVTPHAANLTIESDVATILRENGQSLEEVGGIIWSHAHFDHTGDPNTFPTTTDLIVGPGFKAEYSSAYPTIPDSPVDERSWQGRTLREIDFTTEGDGSKIGQYPAFDFYGDGSFYLLDTPGHAVGHICALARTTSNPPTFMFLGGDIAHQAGEFRPSQYQPLPDSITPSPLNPPFSHAASFCPGEVFQAIHPSKSRSEPFFKPSSTEHSVHLDPAEAMQSLERMTEFDAYENVFSVIAHDKSLFDVVEFYPKVANEWKEKGWGKEGTWRFLREFDAGVELK